jgi:hypothetical protein
MIGAKLIERPAVERSNIGDNTPQYPTFCHISHTSWGIIWDNGGYMGEFSLEKMF